MTEQEVDLVMEDARRFVCTHLRHLGGVACPPAVTKLIDDAELTANLELDMENEILARVLFPKLGTADCERIADLMLTRRIILDSDKPQTLKLEHFNSEFTALYARLKSSLTEFQNALFQTKFGNLMR